MEEQASVEELLEKLLEIASPLAPFDMPLLDAHGATLATDIYAGERLVMRAGSRIRSTQIGLAASIGLDRLPTMPHPRVVVISAGNDLIEPGQLRGEAEGDYETNSWMLTSAVREAGANGFRVHMIPENHQQLKEVIEDQLVRADFILISGARHDESFELITAVLKELGQITTVLPKMSESGLHNFGLIGPDMTPVFTLPGDPVAAGIAAEIFVRPMIRKMLGSPNIFRNQLKAKLKGSITSNSGESSFVRVVLSSENGVVASVLKEQGDLVSLSDAHALVIVPENSAGIKTGEIVDVMVLERSSN
jgi:molybdopterin molybdotransferase